MNSTRRGGFTWWVVSGRSEIKSQNMSASFRCVLGFRFWVWMKLRSASTHKNAAGNEGGETARRRGGSREAHQVGCSTPIDENNIILGVVQIGSQHQKWDIGATAFCICHARTLSVRILPPARFNSQELDGVGLRARLPELSAQTWCAFHVRGVFGPLPAHS